MCEPKLIIPIKHLFQVHNRLLSNLINAKLNLLLKHLSQQGP